MGDMDLDDIEDMLEAPYKVVEKTIADILPVADTEMKNKETNGATHDNTNGHAVQENGNGTIASENGNESVHSQDDEKSKEKHRSKSPENNKENSKSRKKSSRKKSRSRSRDRSRDRRHKRCSRSRSRSRSKKSKRDRSKSRDRDRRRRSHSREDRHKRRDRSSSRRRRSKSRETRRHRRSYSRTPPKRVRSPELTPEERDVRTVFCMQLSNRIRPRDLEEFFMPCGKVRDVRLITDPRTKRSKGIAYIEFRDVDSVEKAIALTGQRILGVPIICKLTQAEKNRMPLVIPNQGTAIIPLTGHMKLYIGSLHVNINEDMLKGIFEPFGNIDAIVLCKDDFGRSKGYGYIQFSDADDAKKAMEQLNNFELANRPIKVAPFIEKATDVGQIANLDNEELDKAGVNLGPSGKLALMAKLAEGTGIKIPQQTLDAIVASKIEEKEEEAEAESAQATQCFMLSNMFDLAEEKTRPNWVQEIKDDVIEECSKYGGVVHISIDENAPEGCIYIKCQSVSVAMATMAGLNGRYFAGKLIQASFISVSNYNESFPDAVDCTKVLVASE